MNRYEEWLQPRCQMRCATRVVVWVNCGGERHKVILAANGHIAFPHHDWQTEAVLESLGGKRCY